MGRRLDFINLSVLLLFKRQNYHHFSTIFAPDNVLFLRDNHLRKNMEEILVQFKSNKKKR